MMKSGFVRRIPLCLGLLLFGSACMKPTPPEPHSEIVATVEQAGSGDLSSTAAPQIEDWLRKHRDPAVQADDLCKSAKHNANAHWATAPEGSVCNTPNN